MSDEISNIDDQITPPDETERLKARIQQQEKSLAALEANRQKALDEAKRLKRINKLMASIGIDSEDEDAETILAERLLGAPSAAAATTTAAVDPPTDAPPSAPAAAPPVEDPIREAELKRLQRQVQKLTEDAAAAEKAKEEAVARNKADKIERIVVEALQRAGAANPSHAYRLMLIDPRFQVDLSQDGTSVVGGPDYDPKPLSDVVAAFRDDEAFTYMFQATGVAGSGLGARNGSGANANGGGGSANNPFRSDSLNLTEAAMLWQASPEKAKRLIAEARSVGKLDPKIPSTFTS